LLNTGEKGLVGGSGIHQIRFQPLLQNALKSFSTSVPAGRAFNAPRDP